MSEIEDRRQRAREAGYDAVPAIQGDSDMLAVEAAIETATTVAWGPEVEDAFDDYFHAELHALGGGHVERIRELLAALGFELST